MSYYDEQEFVTGEENTDLAVDIPEPETTVIAFDAISDTLDQEVTGAEGLTFAQSYMAGVLMANSMIPNSVTGSESLFSAIGSGISKTIEFIKDTFKKIWNFFFNRDAKKEADEAEKEINKVEKEIDKMSEEEVEKASEKLESSVSQSTTTGVNNLNKGLETDKSLLKKIEGMVAGARDEAKALLEKAIKYTKENIKLREESIKGLNNVKEKTKESNPKKKQFWKAALGNIRTHVVKTGRRIVDGFNSISSDISKAISNLETKAKSGEEEDKSYVKSSLDVLKAVMTQGNLAAKEVAANNHTVKQTQASTYDYIYTG